MKLFVQAQKIRNLGLSGPKLGSFYYITFLPNPTALEWIHIIKNPQLIKIDQILVYLIAFIFLNILICIHSSSHELASITLLPFNFKYCVSANNMPMNSDCLIKLNKMYPCSYSDTLPQNIPLPPTQNASCTELSKSLFCSKHEPCSILQ